MVFFSNDSVYCAFTGFSPQFRYATPSNLPGGGETCFSGVAWSFRSANVGFYTYPNPYKPGVDPRHCPAGGPCGIWFKNLHTLGVDLSEVTVTVFGVSAHPVFDSRTAGIRIAFGPGSGSLPQWCWTTRNTRGDPVGSGIYLYAIYTAAGSVLRTGKLIIVR
jgi:hypothetical protein